ncbi:NADPH2:quinone reductase [Actinomadura hallensis]|uniref:NADPH2:quinone reductase n=1 Tax=Actinomadura hallensis TaxID=337895 RepID=A0A543IBC6_9ACTN|nr:quinone oxidoreductase [Actinomadura hallensis]TQM67895.1 NADPH2:quinone reductase [Actinomadura hallensis]HLV75865.1 quinone oxidoreductase [Vulgatibacteraceae bacterium]
MRAIVITENGGPEVLTAGERPDPEPGPGEVLIDVAAAGVNFIDVYFRTGAYPQKLPYTPGVEAAGTVAAVGEGVTEFSAGDRVAWANVQGAYAERAVVPADKVVPVPEEVSLEDAAASLLQGMTAHYLTRSTYRIQEGDTVLVHAAAGGMGLLLTQVATSLGARVIGTASTPEKEKLAKDAGADVTMGYDGFPEKVRELTGGEGVAVVYDGVGAPTFDGSLASLRRRGVLALYGAAGGPVPPFDPQRLNAAGSVYLTRPSLAHFTEDRAELLERAADVFAWVRSGTVRIHVGHRYGLADAAAAHADLESRRSTGKLLILP